MSLSAWEQDALDSIRNGLADADPALVARLEAELEDLLRQGDIRLPGPVAAPADRP